MKRQFLKKLFHIVCEGMMPHGVIEEQMNLRVFPFSLKDDAKDWFYFLPAGFITTWKALHELHE